MTTQSLDFESLLSKKYKAAGISQVTADEKYNPNRIIRKRHVPTKQDREELERKRQTSQLVLSLVSQTPTYQKLQPDRTFESDLVQMPPPPPKSFHFLDIPSEYHPVNIENWIDKVQWDSLQPIEKTNTALELLQKKRNPYLENIRLDKIDWEGGVENLRRKAENIPLILELGVAGQSVARHIYQNTVLERPTPAVKNEAYQKRMEQSWAAQPITSTAEVSKGTLHKDKEELEAIREARQRKRERMEKEKTVRITKAMGTLKNLLGGGRGRTIKSSLMGPGGTERTGRPSKQVGSTAIDAEYIEQLDMITMHQLHKDLSKVMLREFNRPKLPRSVVRSDLSWQLQIRIVGSGGKADTPGAAGSFQFSLMGSTAGAISKAKLRSENDLSPSEGKLVLLEYSEERPPLQMTKGMACKIVNYYRGDRSQCPVSAGGGDRPARRKRQGESRETSSKVERLPRLTGLDKETTIIDWVGKMPKKRKESQQEDIDILPEGVTEVLHPKVHGPFIGEVEEGTTQSGVVSNLFVAPIFYHESEETDFIMILTPPSGAAKIGQRDTMGVILRDMPKSTFAVGQVEPRTRVHPPQSQNEKNFLNPFVEYQAARALTRSQARDGHGLRLDELLDRVLPSLDLTANAMRQKLKAVALPDNNGVWSSMPIGYVRKDKNGQPTGKPYPGVDALAKSVPPEGIAAFEMACAAARRLSDLGIQQLYRDYTVPTIGLAMVYLTAELTSTRAILRNLKKRINVARSTKSITALQVALAEEAEAAIDKRLRMLRQIHEVATFIYEEVQLAPWHLTNEFIDVHKNAQGTGMMKLTGLGDPSGNGEAFSFLREADTKPTKSGVGAAASQKKITGTENDLRKLDMKQMASILRSYGMPQKEIDTLKRWDRVHAIRDLSTKAASDGIGDGLERFARGEKMKLAEQKQMYKDRIKVIWKRQAAALSVEAGGVSGPGAPIEDSDRKEKAAENSKDESESDSDGDSDDDLADEFFDEMMDRNETNKLLTKGSDASGDRSKLHAAAKDEVNAKDAQEFAALRRQREEEKATQEDLQSGFSSGVSSISTLGVKKKVVRKKVTKTHPDGRQEVFFQFIVQPDEVGKIMAKVNAEVDKVKLREVNTKPDPAEKPPGHAIFEDEDDFDYSTKSRSSSRGRRGRTTPKGRNLPGGKQKARPSFKRKRGDDDDLDVYPTTKRKGTSDRRARGSIRDRRPHIIYSQKLEEIRALVESRPNSNPFHKPVNRRLIPRYYEIISNPMDLSTIREKIGKYEYRSADTFVRDFELMKMNAIKFNGEASPIAQEAVAIHQFVKDQVEASRSELSKLEDSVEELMSGTTKKKARKPKKHVNTGTIGGVAVNLGDLPQGMDDDDSDSGDEDDFVIDL